MTKKSIDEILSDLDEPEKDEGKTSKKEAKANKKKKRNWKKRILLFVTLVVLISGCFFGFKAYNTVRDIFQSGGSLPELLGITSTDLKGVNEDRINILLLGMGGGAHEGPNLTDTIMLISVKPSTKQVAMISIPRDLYVKIDGYGYNKINAANAYGEQYNYSGGGMTLAKETVSNVVNLPIHYSVRIDFEGFEQLIDAVGGVDILVEKDLYDPLYPGETFYVKAGQQHLDGASALKYSRSRETTSDFDRARRQQQVLLDLKNKLFSLNTLANPKKINDILGILGDHINTDMKMNEAQALGRMLSDLDSGNIINRVLDNGSDGLLVASNLSGYTLSPRTGNFKEIQNFAKNIFSASKIQDEKASIEVLNGSGVAGKAKALAEELEELGFVISNVDNAIETVLTTRIIDHSGAVPATITALEKELGVTVSVDNQSTSNYDVTIVVGRDK